ncbi:GNAT family N-acetyltransferase [Candidatus Woesearchaeota archaeon]|nr:GNAT family N-acetyltransferase [Candidatus Woesearchaeota archaeon]
MVKIRKYQKRDKDDVRRICCDTGFVGKPIDPIFQDRDLWADALTSYYLDIEPESCFVLEDRGRVVGYLFGCVDLWKLELYISAIKMRMLGKVIFRYFFAGYNKRTKKMIRYLLFTRMGEEAKVVRNFAHLHINLEPKYRNQKNGTKLVQTYFDYLKKKDAKGCYIQTFGFKGSRSENFFRRLGFKEYDKVRIHIWDDYLEGPIYSVSMIKVL